MDAATDVRSAQSEMSFSRPTADTLLVRLSGSWKMQDRLPSATEVQQQIASGPRVQRVAFDTQGVTAWDSGLVTFLMKVLFQNMQNQLETDQAGLPDGPGGPAGRGETTPGTRHRCSGAGGRGQTSGTRPSAGPHRHGRDRRIQDSNGDARLPWRGRADVSQVFGR